MGALARFLLALGNLIRSGGIKKIEEAIEFAKNEFGEVTPLLQKQIEKVFKTAKKPKTEKKGEVVPIKKKIGLSKYDDEALNRLVDDDICRAPADRKSVV